MIRIFKNQKLRFAISSLSFCAILCSGLFFTDCGKSPFCSGKEKNKGIIIEVVDPGCFPDPNSKERVIESDSAFRALFPFSNLSIDFSQYTLLGNAVSGGCEIKLTREVIESDNSYVYNIDVNECGICKKLVTRCSWVKVPRLPAGWTVKFNVRKK